MSEIVERISGYTDQQMLDRCLSFQKVLSKTETKHTGRGRNVRHYEKLKWEGAKDALDRVNRSIEHYKKLIEKK